MKSTMPNALSTETQRGLLRLASLSLAYCPAGDVMMMTERTWIDALTDEGLSDNDAWRVSIAFRVLARTFNTWPAPRDLIDALPPRPREYFTAMPAPKLTPEQEAAGKARRVETIARVRAMLAPYLNKATGRTSGGDRETV
jgi:hypothetical protein